MDLCWIESFLLHNYHPDHQLHCWLLPLTNGETFLVTKDIIYSAMGVTRNRLKDDQGYVPNICMDATRSMTVNQQRKTTGRPVQGMWMLSYRFHVLKTWRNMFRPYAPGCSMVIPQRSSLLLNLSSERASLTKVCLNRKTISLKPMIVFPHVQTEHATNKVFEGWCISNYFSAVATGKKVKN